MQTMSPIQAHAEIERFSNHERMPETRMVEAIAVGEWVRQGDVALLRIDARECSWQPTTNRQLAPGTSQGSRHVVSAGPALFVSQESRPTSRHGDTIRLLGPLVVADERFVVTHPEHAHISLPAGSYQVIFQLDYASQQAVRD